LNKRGIKREKSKKSKPENPPVERINGELLLKLRKKVKKTHKKVLTKGGEYDRIIERC